MRSPFQRTACVAFLAAMAALAPIVALGQTSAAEQAPRYEFGAELRARAQTRNGGGDDPTKQDAFTTTRLRFDATVRPTRQVRIFVEAQDSHVQGFASGRDNRAFKDPVDIRQGYLALGREDGPLTFFVGRRELSFIDERIIGIRNWSNISPAWDGSELVLRRGKDSVNLLAVTQVDISDGFDPPSRTRWVYGAVGVIGSGLGGHQIEPFFFHVATPSGSGLESRRGVAHRRFAILGAARRELGLPSHPRGPGGPDTEPEPGRLDGGLGAWQDARAASLAA